VVDPAAAELQDLVRLTVRVVLASGSPRRTLLLAAAGIPHRVVVPDVDESILDGEDPSAYVLRLSGDKAGAVDAGQGDVVVGADTTVVHDETILGKPADGEEALSMLRRLAGTSHSVLTGWTVRSGDSERFGVAETTVHFHRRSDAELRDYVEATQPFDKAGAYAIQGDRGFLVAGFTGSRSNVMGLPMAEVVGALSEFGIERSAS
jgi:septum formation protein